MRLIQNSYGEDHGCLCLAIRFLLPETSFAHLLLPERFIMLNTISNTSTTVPSSTSTQPELLSLSPFEQRLSRALADLRNGRPVLLMDDFDRENEADLLVAAEKITVESMARLIRDCSGIVCLCLTDDRLQQLDLPPMVSHNESRYGTAFTVSIEAKHGVTTGVSAADRVTTVLAAIAPDAQPGHLARPGHVFPLRAAPGGVLSRRGHTEGSVDLAIMAGLSPAAVLCELMNPDGSMAKGGQILEYAVAHDIVILTIDELASYRASTAV